MRYLLLIGSARAAPPPAPGEMEPVVQGHRRVSEELERAGKMVVSERLRPDGEGCRVRLEAGQRVVTDGAPAGAAEAIGGFYVIDCATREEAVEWARRLPLREGGFVEVRPVWHM
jgi:hypothetical protein